MNHMDSKYNDILQNLTDANTDEWQRLVEENPELLAALEDIQRKHSLPLPMPTKPGDTIAGAAQWGEWLERCQTWPKEHPSEKLCILESILTLAERFRISEKLYIALFFVVVMGVCEPAPEFALGQAWGALFTDGSDLYIRTGHPYFRKAAIELMLRNDPPPRPQHAKDNRRKLDWRPLHEWHMRHPVVTITEVARVLNYNAVTVRRKLAELDYTK